MSARSSSEGSTVIVPSAPATYCTVAEKVIALVGDPEDPIILYSPDDKVFTSLFTRPFKGEPFAFVTEVYDPLQEEGWQRFLRQPLYLEHRGELYVSGIGYNFDPAKIAPRERKVILLARDESSGLYYCVTADAVLPLPETYFLYVGSGEHMRRLRIRDLIPCGKGFCYETAEGLLTVTPAKSPVISWESLRLRGLDLKKYLIQESALGEMRITRR